MLCDNDASDFLCISFHEKINGMVRSSLEISGSDGGAVWNIICSAAAVDLSAGTAADGTADQVLWIFMIIMGITIVFIVSISENKILYLLASVLLLIISTILNLLYQYMQYETIHGIPVLKQLLPFLITLSPLYIHMAVCRIHSLRLSGKLKEINRDDYFLMEKLSEEDAITYYHSMEVSDLAVRVAVSLGLNREIVMAGARYHEIGKLIGKNYVAHGIKLLNQYGFPREVIQIVKEHNSKMNKPQSMESAVVMLSDTVVSTLNTIMESRGIGNTNQAKIVKNILELRLESGILEEVLTDTKEYLRLKQAFVQVYL